LVLAAEGTEGFEIQLCIPVYYRQFQGWCVLPEDGIVMPKHVGVQ
jgi:hypothetical protein